MRTLFTLLGSCVLVFSAFGQGQVGFANTSSTLFTTNGSLLGQGAGLTSGVNHYRIGLYVAPDGTTDESMFTLIAVATNRSSPFNGFFSYPQNPLAIPGNNGTPIAFQVKAWSLWAGNSAEEALAYYFATRLCVYGGKSPIGRVTPATGVGPPPALFGTGDYAGQLTSGLVLNPGLLCTVPEPSVCALAGLGAAALLCICKQRRVK